MSNPPTQSQLLRSLTSLSKKREDVYALANVIYNNSKKLTVDSVKLFQTQLQHLEKLENEFSRIQNEIISINSSLDDNKNAVETTNISLSFYELLWTSKANFQKFDVKPTLENTNVIPPASSSIPLAPMQIPTFDGTVSAWTEFIALFDQLIHNNTSLSDVQKFYYLKTLVTGEAAKIISNLDISAVNYTIAYSALTKRFASKRRLANRYMCEILHYRSTGKESEYLSIHENAVKSLKAMRVPDLADYVLFRNCYENLSPKMKYLFDDRSDPQNVPTCQELFDFVLHHTQNSELRLDTQVSLKPISKYENKNFTVVKKSPKMFFTKTDDKINSKQSVEPNSYKKPYTCPMCKGEHSIYSCSDFLKLNVSERQRVIERLERCLNCFGMHNIQRCQSDKVCAKCSKKHHTFLHDDSIHLNNKKSSDFGPLCHFLNADTSSVVILGTFLAQIQDNHEEYHQIRCVTDPGSQISAITKELVHKLGLKIQRVDCSVSGLANSTSKTTEKLSVSLRSCHDDQTSFNFSAYVFPKICDTLPSQKIIPQSDLKHLKNLKLADPFFNQPSSIDLLLSAEMSAAILSKQTPNLITGEPTAIRTAFGWILYGSIPVISDSIQLTSQTLFTLQDSLHKFWELEEVPSKKFSSPEEDWCEAHFLKTHSRDETGRYIVSLPFRTDRLPLASNRHFAMKRWLNLEKKLLACPEKKEAYDAVLQEYLDKKHMEIASSSSEYILPHHAVSKISSTTKLRVVFDASAKDAHGLSLNDRLFIGPKLQKDITKIISTFRSFRFALCGDISQMYRMIWLNPSDRNCQHIFWRKNCSTSVSEFELTTLTFGLAPSPFLAQRVISQLVQDEGEKYELASRALIQHTYIDDVITGVNSIEEGRALQSELITLLAKGGFHLRKWCSNTSQLLKNVPVEDLETPLEFLDGSLGLKVLGLFWNPQSDIFTYQVQPFIGKITKRTILSFVARIYDPMGWLAPVTIKAKCFLQKLWMLKLDWDTELPDHVQEDWLSFSQNFKSLSYIQIPRTLQKGNDYNNSQYRLLGFCDASEFAYAACVYLQNLKLKNSPLILLQAKTKVAPLKTITIACLELCGALLLTRLVNSMTPPFPIQDIKYYTDSKIVLTWLQTPLHRLKIFVANRVAQILENSKFSQWNHISGTHNPADLASRGVLPENLFHNKLWWSGPGEIHSDNFFTVLPPSEVPELKPDCNKKCFLALKSTGEFIKFFENVSSWVRLQRIMARILRFIFNCRFPDKRPKETWLSADEYKKATKQIIILTQTHYFSSEIRALKRGEIPRSFSSLHPFFDSFGCLRVGGRLSNSKLRFNSKHPYLLPKHSHITTLIIRHFHANSLHAGPSTVQAVIQTEYWIPSLRNLVKKYTFQCVRCHRLKASSLQPKMGSLPVERVTVSRPFSRTATDFAGPFLIKESTKRNSRHLKCYLCIFVCMATKAVHLEAVSALTTEAFLAAFTRFFSRRGLPATVLSDNGRNFVGAAREIKELQQWLKQNEEEIGSSLATKSIMWKFNPPEAPHFGGLFEAAIKSTKSLLYRLIGNQSLTFEELCTLFSRIEAVLNSRPITSLSSDPSEDYLAPSHFLIGGLLHQTPEECLDNMTSTSRWKKVQQLSQSFWKQWSTQYLQQLMPRTRWQKESSPIKVGDLVYLKNQTTSPLTWPMGRVTETFPGADGIIRVVSVRTTSGSYIRPTNKLVPLSLEE